MGDDNWDLQAVVRSCCRATSHVGGDTLCSASPSPVLLANAQTSNPQPFQELQEACRPFFVGPPKQEVERRAPPLLGHFQQPKQRLLPNAARSKRRKNQVKKVVCQVPADGVCSDVWAWRKYGQKPIKGSPFPRGYYRCSSSKGCPARKLVERSCTDPSSFIVTYTAEHNHPAPAHRSCLAGSTRPTKSTQKKDSSSSSNASDAAIGGLSPTTPLTTADEDDDELLMGLGEEFDTSDSAGVADFRCYSC